MALIKRCSKGEIDIPHPWGEQKQLPIEAISNLFEKSDVERNLIAENRNINSLKFG